MRTYKNEVAAWIARNQESLSEEYRAYAFRHDYDIGGIMPYESWCVRQFHMELEYRKWEAAREYARKTL